MRGCGGSSGLRDLSRGRGGGGSGCAGPVPGATPAGPPGLPPLGGATVGTGADAESRWVPVLREPSLLPWVVVVVVVGGVTRGL